jgi:hypothetical protein
MQTRLALTLALLAASLGAAGCNKLKTEVVEDTIKQDVAKKGHTLKSLTCPQGLEFKQQAFDCSGVDGAGKPVAVKVTIRPTDGGKAEIKYTTTIDGKALANLPAASPGTTPGQGAGRGAAGGGG